MEIPNGEILFRYASPEAFPKDQLEIPTSVFQDIELSCDWEKYMKEPQKSPHMTAGRTIIISITICDEIRKPKNPRGVEVPSNFQEVLHDPLDESGNFGPNYSHSLIKGRKKQFALDAIRKNSIWNS